MEGWVRRIHTRRERRSFTPRYHKSEKIWAHGNGFLKLGCKVREKSKHWLRLEVKGKNLRVLQELDENAISKKGSKFEGEVVEMGQLMAKHMRLAEAAGQLRRKQ